MTSQWVIVLVGAILVGLIVVGVSSSYVSVTSSKLPSPPEMIKLFVSGSIVGAAVSWIISSGYLHGSTLLTMLGSDIKEVAKGAASVAAKELGIKGGMEVVPEVNQDLTKTVTAMVGGFFNSVGLGGNTEVSPEMNVGMPAF